MNYRGVLFMLGGLFLALALVMLVPAALAWFRGEPEVHAFLVAAGVTGAMGLIAERGFRHGLEDRFGRREAFVLVSAAWVLASLVGAIPYVLIKGPAFWVDGLFESVSGFTTTGTTVLDALEEESQSLLLWRSLTQWLGGMGIIVLGIAILPKLAIGGMQLLGAEAPGPIPEKLTPRIAQTAKALWGIYLLFTGIQCGVLLALGMAPLEAVNHSMTTMATSGFSTRGASIGAFGPAVQWVVALFMLIAGINFALHFHLLRGKVDRLFSNSELKVYLGLVVTVSLALSIDLWFQGGVSDVSDALRLGTFQALTFITTTGYATADYDAWPTFSRALLFSLMFVGACAGSTCGSVKVIRIMIVFKKIGVEVRRMLQPRAVFPVRIDRQAIPDEVVNQVTTFLLVFVGLFAAGGLVLGLVGLDPVSAFSASATCVANVGPAFGDLGPTQTAAGVPAVGKLIMVGLMIIGRLELYTVLVALYLASRPMA